MLNVQMLLSAPPFVFDRNSNIRKLERYFVFISLFFSLLYFCPIPTDFITQLLRVALACDNVNKTFRFCMLVGCFITYNPVYFLRTSVMYSLGPRNSISGHSG